jgi:hypothetical protein
MRWTQANLGWQKCSSSWLSAFYGSQLVVARTGRADILWLHIGVTSDRGEGRSSGNTLVQWRQGDIWHVLDSDGSPIARLQLPTRTRLLDVRSDRVAVVTRDEFDVEHVRVFAINRGGEAPREQP